MLRRLSRSYPAACIMRAAAFMRCAVATALGSRRRESMRVLVLVIILALLLPLLAALQYSWLGQLSKAEVSQMKSCRLRPTVSLRISTVSWLPFTAGSDRNRRPRPQVRVSITATCTPVGCQIPGSRALLRMSGSFPLRTTPSRTSNVSLRRAANSRRPLGLRI